MTTPKKEQLNHWRSDTEYDRDADLTIAQWDALKSLGMVCISAHPDNDSADDDITYEIMTRWTKDINPYRALSMPDGDVGVHYHRVPTTSFLVASMRARWCTIDKLLCDEAKQDNFPS